MLNILKCKINCIYHMSIDQMTILVLKSFGNSRVLTMIGNLFHELPAWYANDLRPKFVVWHFGRRILLSECRLWLSLFSVNIRTWVIDHWRPCIVYHLSTISVRHLVYIIYVRHSIWLTIVTAILKTSAAKADYQVFYLFVFLTIYDIVLSEKLTKSELYRCACAYAFNPLIHWLTSGMLSCSVKAIHFVSNAVRFKYVFRDSHVIIYGKCYSHKRQGVMIFNHRTKNLHNALVKMGHTTTCIFQQWWQWVTQRTTYFLRKNLFSPPIIKMGHTTTCFFPTIVKMGHTTTCLF